MGSVQMLRWVQYKKNANKKTQRASPGEIMCYCVLFAAIFLIIFFCLLFFTSTCITQHKFKYRSASFCLASNGGRLNYLPRSGTKHTFHHINGALKLSALLDAFFSIIPECSIPQIHTEQYCRAEAAFSVTKKSNLFS